MPKEKKLQRRNTSDSNLAANTREARPESQDEKHRGVENER